MPFRVFYDALQEAEWFKSLVPELSQAQSIRMVREGNQNPIVDRLVEYDRPDILLELDGRVVFGLEKTEEVPTGHNVGQRFPRIVRAAEMGVPFVKFFPFVAMKHGEYRGRCFVNARLFKAFERISRIHGVPIIAVNWPCDAYYELVRDGSEKRELVALLQELISLNFDTRRSQLVPKLQAKMAAEYAERVSMNPRYKDPPPSVKIVKTLDLVRQLRRRFGASNFPAHVVSRDESVVYRFEMTERCCRRQDPYTGMQFIYDYIWCRSGPKPQDKYRNLFLECPKVSTATWLDANPDTPGSKSHLYYTLANGIILKDSVIQTSI
ncbi:MAG: hypothetical protein ACTSYX_04605 [Candidatus Thorarchaeota archaeon]